MRRTEDEFGRCYWTNNFFLACYVILGLYAFYVVVK
jgi:hypothetical protein